MSRSSPVRRVGCIGEYLIEEFARIPVEVDYASEFRYRNPIVGVDDVVKRLENHNHLNG